MALKEFKIKTKKLRFTKDGVKLLKILKDVIIIYKIEKEKIF